MIGGAYGCFGSFTRNGKVTFASYRDPNLRRTLEIYEKAEQYLEDFHAGERDMTSDLDFPLTPSAKGLRSHDAYLCHDTVEKVQKERDEILGCTSDDIRNLAKYVVKIKDDACVCVLGGEEEINKEKDMFNKIEPLFLR